MPRYSCVDDGFAGVKLMLVAVIDLKDAYFFGK